MERFELFLFSIFSPRLIETLHWKFFFFPDYLQPLHYHNKNLKVTLNIYWLTLPLRGTDSVGRRGGASEAPPKKSMMEWAETPCCYVHIVKV